MVNTLELTLTGGGGDGLRVPIDILVEAMDALREGARQATRFTVEGESVRKGPRPAWLDAVCAIEITGLSPGSAIFAIEAPTLAEASPDRFGEGSQDMLWERPNAPSLGPQTAVDIFGDFLASLANDDARDIRADRSLLDACARFARCAGPGFNGVQLGGLLNRSPVRLNGEHAVKIERLRDETPPNQTVQLTGILDTISSSSPRALLKLADGTTLALRLDSIQPDVLKQFFGASVSLSGCASYRPSGRLLVLHVDSIEPAGEGDGLFTAAAHAGSSHPLVTPALVDDEAGLSAFFGAWPGQETESELLDSLRAIG